MLHSLSRAEVRSIDRRAVEEFGMSSLVLMENAGRGCVEVLCQVGCVGRVAIVCGRGNNAGDGFVIARHLELQGVEVQVVLLADPAKLRGDAAANYYILERSGLPVVSLGDSYDEAALLRALSGADWIVDALLGTGAVGPPRKPWDRVIDLLNQFPARRLAVDLPSGLDCDSCLPSPSTVRADHSCSFVAPKRGFSNSAAKPFLGQVHVVGIGAPRTLLDDYGGDNDES
jgi:NAD(P)H-hydrate epimerase